MSEAESPQKEAMPWRERVWFWPVLVAGLIRVPLAFIADDQWGDAPIRFDMLQRWIAAPGVWWSFHRTYQYGPFPTHFVGALGVAGFGAQAASRIAVAGLGILSCGLLAVLAQKAGGRRSGIAAGFALALSPIHIQASTTFASEAIYLAFALGCVWAAWERRAFVLVAVAFAASTTRYDAWIWLPLLGLWFLANGKAEDRRRDLVTVALLGLGPASILLANAIILHDPLAPLNYIAQDHLQLVARSEAAFGVRPWRLMMAAYWPGAIIGVLSPAFGIAILIGVFRSFRWKSPAFLPIAIGGVIPLLYAFKTVAMGTLWPMARFVLGPVALLAVAMPPLRRGALAACIAVAVIGDVGLAIVGDGKPGIGLMAAAMSPVSRLPADLRAGGDALRAAHGPVALDWVPTYEDVLVAYESGMNRYKLLHPEPGTVPQRIVSIVGGNWDTELKHTAHAFGHAYRQTGGEGRVSWWDLADSR